MNSYFIQNTNGQIIVSDMSSDGLTILKRNGETSQDYEKDDFWSWFKNKIEYDNEALCFVITSDDEDFTLDDSLQVADQQYFTEIEIENLLLGEIEASMNITCIPEMTINISIPDNILETTPQAKKKSSIQHYYRKQTSKMKEKS